MEDKDLTDALRRTFLLPSGERRRGLSLHDQRQGLISFLQCVRHKLRLGTLEVFNTQRIQKLKHCVTDAVRAGIWLPAAVLCPLLCWFGERPFCCMQLLSLDLA